MATKINRTVVINGEKKWIHANTEQEYADKLIKLFSAGEAPARNTHNFRTYAENWFEVYSKPNIEQATVACYRVLLRKHLFPALEHMAVEEISSEHVQKLFNAMTGAKTTKQKARAVLNMILETARDEGIIDRNPLDSKRIKITGASSKVTQPYSVEQMRFLVQNLDKVENPMDRTYLAIQALHPLRLEEVLGLKWGDIDFENRLIYIQRAVTHPDRNQPIIKSTKTASSVRRIGLSAIAAEHLTPGDPEEFVVGGEKPLSYHRVMNMCNRIRKDVGFDEKITPKRFRTTVLTDIYDRTKDIKATQAAAGHTTSEMTLEHYVKGRGTAGRTISAVDEVYGQ